MEINEANNFFQILDKKWHGTLCAKWKKFPFFDDNVQKNLFLPKFFLTTSKRNDIILKGL